MLKSLVVREMQIKSAMRYQFISIKMTAIKKQNTKVLVRNVEKLEHFARLVGIDNGEVVLKRYGC